MGNAANVQFIVQTEPWRNGQGMPRSFLDPIWADDTIIKCSATIHDLEYEPGTNWWWCTKCGKCSSAYFLEHYIVEAPRRYYELSFNQFIKRRSTQGLSNEEAIDQAYHVMGIVLRAAASKRPEDLIKLAEEILQLCN